MFKRGFVSVRLCLRKHKCCLGMHGRVLHDRTAMSNCSHTVFDCLEPNRYDLKHERFADYRRRDGRAVKKTRKAELAGKIQSVFRCPLCGGGMKVQDLKSLVCTRNHTFDFARQGYVNFLSHPPADKYSKELFEARHSLIAESRMFQPMHELIAKTIRERVTVDAEPFMIADLGCGEGSHLHHILKWCNISGQTGVGLDIAKEGILLASRNYEEPIWLVGDLAKLPLADRSFQAIFNLFSPANYSEFNRILAQGGTVIKAVPRENYLRELREAVYGGEKAYKNEETVSLFAAHFRLDDVLHVRYTRQLDRKELQLLARMTPLTWSADPERIQRFTDQESAEITVDLDLLIGSRAE